MIFYWINEILLTEDKKEDKKEIMKISIKKHFWSLL